MNAFIFARGGSKELPGKNIRIMAGKPLIAWTIELALAMNMFESVVVSTDSEEIADVARLYGANVPFMRPSELATDESPEWSAWKHAAEYLLESNLSQPGPLISLPATAPLRLPSDVEKCIDLYFESEADAVISVTKSARNPKYNMVSKTKDSKVELLDSSEQNLARRQDAPQTFDITTVCYVLDTEFLFKKQSLFEGRVEAIEIPQERSVDIDSLFDFRIAEFLIRERIESRLHSERLQK